MMADDRRAGLGAAGPVAAGRILVALYRAALRVRAGQDIMHVVGLVAAARNHLALLAERSLLVDVVLGAVQIVDALGDEFAFHVVPGAFANAVSRVDRLVPGGAQIGPPGLAFASGRRRELLAVGVGASDPAQVGALAGAFAGDEE